MKNKFFKKSAIFLLTFVIYIAGTLPLRDILAVFTVTDVRPGAVINPFLSMCFGPVASLACAVSNFVADFISGYPNTILIEGLPLQFLYGFISYLLWKKLTKGDDHSYRLDSVTKVLKFILVAFVYAIISCIGVGLLVVTNYGGSLFDVAKFVFLNNFDMTVVLGLPLMIVANIVVSGIHREKFRTLSLNELIIIFASVIEIIGIGVIIYATYSTYINAINQTYEVWNNIFFYSVIFINLTIVAMLIFMKLIENKFKN